MFYGCRFGNRKDGNKGDKSAIEFEFTAEVTLEIYRLGVNLEEENMEISPIPADIIRRIIAIGDRRSGGLLEGSDLQATIPLASGDYNLRFRILA